MHSCMTVARYVHWCLAALGRTDRGMRIFTSLVAVAIALLGSVGAPERGERDERVDGDSSLACERAGEHCHALTLVRRGGRWLELTEEVTFDAAGLLVHAETSSRDLRVVYDRPTSTVVVTTRGATTVTRIDEGPRPWTYGAVESGERGAIPTRLAAWVTYRAGRAAPAIRVVDAARGGSVVVPSDQLVFDTERGTVIVIGEEAVLLRAP